MKLLSILLASRVSPNSDQTVTALPMFSETYFSVLFTFNLYSLCTGNTRHIVTCVVKMEAEKTGIKLKKREVLIVNRDPVHCLFLA